MPAKNLAFLTAKPKILRFLLIYVLNIRNFFKERKMKKFLVFAAMFAAMFLMISCGGDLNGDGITQDGDKICGEFWREEQCNGHDAKICTENDKTWYEVEGTGKKFYCDKDGECTKAAIELTNYCTGSNMDYDDDGTWCNTVEGEDSNCNGKKVKYCQKDDEIWYEVDDQIFKCDTNNENDCTDAFLKLGEYCGDDENGESEFTEKATAYFPNAYAEKTLAAWYSLTETDEDKIKIEAIFLFDDNTLIKTTSKVYSEADGREPSDELEATGEFTITSGDYDNGEAHVVLAGGEMEFDVTISGGVLSAMGAEFIKQDNADLPEAR